MHAIIFGAGGQDGHYLAEACNMHGITVTGVSRSGGNCIGGSVADFPFVRDLIRTRLPQYIFHLAANSTTRHDALFENHETISGGTLHILEAVKKYSQHTKVFIVGSGVQFKNCGFPISESDPFEASSPYAVSRIQSVYAARYYRSLGFRVYVGYLFHHESPLRQPTHVSQKIVQAVKRIAKGAEEVIELGDISVEKEWTFAGDVAEAMVTLIDQDNVYEAAIGSGVAYSIEQWLNACFSLIGKKWTDFIIVDRTHIPEYKRLVSNPATIRSLGWSQSVSLQQLAALMVNN